MLRSPVHRLSLVAVALLVAAGCTLPAPKASASPGATASPVVAATGGGDAGSTKLAITQPGAVARYSFQGTTGQGVFVDVPSSTLPDECGILALQGPNSTSDLGSGCIIGGSGFIDATVLPASGKYTVVVTSTHGSGEAEVRVVTFTDQQGTISIDGPEVTATITQPGAVARFTFPGTMGQKIFVDVPSSTLPDECGILTLVGPGGARIGSGCVIGGKGLIDATVLPAAGEYTILVDPGVRKTGTAQVRAIAAVDQLGTISVGGAEVTATIAQPGAVARFTFSGTNGQKVSVEVTASDLPDQCGILDLQGPDGSNLAGGCIINGKGTVDATILPAGGQYTIVVDPGDRATGTAQLRLH